MLRDFRFAFRVLASRPAFTLVAALSLALGIGANSAIFSLIDALWFRPMAVPKAGEIVRLFSVTDQDREGVLSYPEFLEFKQQTTALQDLVAVGGRGATLVEGESRQLLTLYLVSANFFTALGVKPALGRLFTSRDEADAPGSTIVVLGDVAMLGLFGIAAGLPMALAATRLCSSLLFGVGPWDVPTFAGVLVLLAAVLFAAGFLPARRATVIDPASALRVF
jgi:hypothetical protein